MINDSDFTVNHGPLSTLRAHSMPAERQTMLWKMGLNSGEISICLAHWKSPHCKKLDNKCSGVRRTSFDWWPLTIFFPSAFGSCQHSLLNPQYSSFIRLKWEKFRVHGGRVSARKRWKNCHHTRILVRFRIQITCASRQNRFNQIIHVVVVLGRNLLLAPEAPCNQTNWSNLSGSRVFSPRCRWTCGPFAFSEGTSSQIVCALDELFDHKTLIYRATLSSIYWFELISTQSAKSIGHKTAGAKTIRAHGIGSEIRVIGAQFFRPAKLWSILCGFCHK